MFHQHMHMNVKDVQLRDLQKIEKRKYLVDNYPDW